jgi:hypothetical protein
MARIDRFMRGRDYFDLEELRNDLLGKILEEHVGVDNAITHEDICRYYFEPYPVSLEDQFLISQALQDVKHLLQESGWFLDWQKGIGWFAVRTTEEAFRHVLRYAKREIRLHQRLQTKAHIATGERYQLPSDNPLIQAIHGTTPSIERLEEAVNNPEPPEPLQLEEGNENQD